MSLLVSILVFRHKSANKPAREIGPLVLKVWHTVSVRVQAFVLCRTLKCPWMFARVTKGRASQHLFSRGSKQLNGGEVKLSRYVFLAFGDACTNDVLHCVACTYDVLHDVACYGIVVDCCEL